METKKPWLDRNGKEFSIKQLKRTSLKWNEKMWEEYLKTLEGYTREQLPSDLEGCIEEYLDKEELKKLKTNDFFKTNDSENQENDYLDRIDGVLDKLTENQKNIIKFIFWENKTENEIANILGISRSSVKITKSRAIEKIHRILSMSPKNTLVERETFFNERKEVINEGNIELA